MCAFVPVLITAECILLHMCMPYPIQYEMRYSRFEAKQLGSCFLITLPEHINRNDSSSDTILI